MILHTLHLSNYKQYAHLELDFREGLVGIIGKNGAGKSTIFEAILYCLFGRDEGNKSHVRSAFSDPKSVVSLELTFSIGEIVYRVRREFRGKTLTVGAELFKNDVLVAKGVSPVNDELVKVLHIERDAFKRSVFSGQKELSELSDTSGEARKRMVRRMLGLDTLDDTQTRVNADLREWASQIAGQRQNLLSDADMSAIKNDLSERHKLLKNNALEIAGARKTLQEAQEKYRAEKEKFDREEARFKRHSSLQNEWAQNEERWAGLDAQKQQLHLKIAALQEQKTALDASRPKFTAYETAKKTLDALEMEHGRFINRRARLEKITETREQLDSSTAKTKAWAAQLQEMAAVETALAQQQKTVADLETEMEAKRVLLRDIDLQIGGIQSGLRERRGKLENLRGLGREGHCPTCLQPLLEGYERALSELEKEINALETKQLHDLDAQKKPIIEAGLALKNQQNAARTKADQWLQKQTILNELARQQSAEETQQRQLQARLAADELILREIGEVAFDEAAYQTLKAKLAAEEPQYREFLTQENYVARELPTAQNAWQTAENSLVQTQQKKQSLRAELQTLGYDETAYVLAKQAVADFTEVFQAQSDTLRALEKTGLEIQNEQSKSTERLSQNDRIQSQISDKLEEVELLRKLSEMLGLFKTEILEKVSPGISREASDLFSRITKGKYEGILVDENFDFAIADGGVFYPIDRFSGGEVDLANFCLRIAITKAIIDLSGASNRLEFLAFDEIFGSQDEERRLEMMLALNYLQEQFRQIYIVSHIDSLKDYFPHLLEIQFAPEGSSAVWR